MQTLRFRIILDGPYLTCVARSGFWGFADIVDLWCEGDWVHLRGRLMIGCYDLGANKKRILARLCQ
ncbi:MAG: hypothetical protein RMX62_08740 [Planktomarina sp.]|nr:hypothetical protein [Planktomarina sp.]